MVKISVVIPCLDEEKQIEDCLKAIRSQIPSKSFGEIIVADGGSKDNTLKIARKYADKILKNKKSISIGRQAGLEAAKGEIVAFTDADSVPSDNWLQECVNLFENESIVGAFGPVKSKEKLRFQSFLELLHKLFLMSFGIIGVPNMVGSNMIMRKDAALKCGGFNKKLKVMEDVDIALRLKKQGKIIFSPKLKVKASIRRFKDLKNISPYFKGWVSYFMHNNTKEVEFTKIR